MSIFNANTGNMTTEPVEHQLQFNVTTYVDMVQNNSRYIRDLNLVVIDIVVNLKKAPFDANVWYAAAGFDDKWMPFRPKALAASSVLTNDNHFEAILDSNTNVIFIKSNTQVTSSQNLSITGTYFLD